MVLEEIKERRKKEKELAIVQPNDEQRWREVDERGAFPKQMLEDARSIPTPDSIDPYDYTLMNLIQIEDLVKASRTPKKIPEGKWNKNVALFDEL